MVALYVVDVWLKYGRTEIFADFGSGDNLRVVEPPQPSLDSSQSLDGVVGVLDAGQPVTLVVDYVAGLKGYLELLETLVDKLSINGFTPKDIEIRVTAWRYFSEHVERECISEVASHLRRRGVEKISGLQPDQSEADILVSPAIFWGGGITTVHRLEKVYTSIIPIISYGGAVAEILVGRPQDIGDRISELVMQRSHLASEEAYDIIVLGGPGHPTDLYLSSSIHLISAVGENVKDKVVIIPLECSGGLGPQSFVDTLTKKVSDDIFGRWVGLWAERAEKNKICMVTATPSSLVEKLLGARHADTLDQALTYAWRVKSKEAKILVLAQSLGSRLENI